MKTTSESALYPTPKHYSLLIAILISVLLILFLNPFRAVAQEITEKSGPVVNLGISENKEDVRIDVFVSDLSQPLFGAAFDLYYDNSVLDYKNFEKGDLFLGGSSEGAPSGRRDGVSSKIGNDEVSSESTDSGDNFVNGQPVGSDLPGNESLGAKMPEPMYLVSHDQNRLITGISLKRGDQMPENGGKLVSFLFKRRALGNIDVRFSRGVLAGFIDDERRDMENVIWQDHKGSNMGQVSMLSLGNWEFPREAVYFVIVLITIFLIAVGGLWGYLYYIQKKSTA